MSTLDKSRFNIKSRGSILLFFFFPNRPHMYFLHNLCKFYVILIICYFLGPLKILDGV